MPVKISVIMPTKNSSTFIARAIESFSSQTWPAKQLVIVDGGSSDDTVDLVRRHLGRDIILHVQHDRSATEAVNRGVAISDGEIVMLLMSDDWLEAGALDAIGRVFGAHQNVELVCGGVQVWANERDQPVLEQTVPAVQPELLGLGRLLGVPYMAAFAIRRHAWTVLHGFSQQYRYGADRDYLMRCRLAGFKAKAVGATVYNYFRHDGSATLSNDPAAVQEFLLDHRRMATRWLRDRALSPQDRKVVSSWLDGEMLALTDILGREGRYARAVALMIADLGGHPRRSVRSARHLVSLALNQLRGDR